jgi:hypothetical protein
VASVWVLGEVRDAFVESQQDPRLFSGDLNKPMVVHPGKPFFMDRRCIVTQLPQILAKVCRQVFVDLELHLA